MSTNIYEIRGRRVMLDQDLAKVYGVETKVLNQAVKRNLVRFPEEFMFQLTLKQTRDLPFLYTFPRLRSQIVTSKRGGRMYKPFAFTEHGAVMLASVLRSERAVKMSIEVVKAFVELRRAISSQEDILKQLAEVRSYILKRSNTVDREFRKLWKTVENLSGVSGEGRMGFIVKFLSFQTLQICISCYSLRVFYQIQYETKTFSNIIWIIVVCNPGSCIY